MAILSTALLCLALNVYHEARGEPLQGMYAVALVTVNRANFQNKEVCEVVKAPYQFSWTIYKPTVLDRDAFLLSQKVAKEVLDGKISDFTSASTFYHTTSIKPVWSKSFRHTIKIGKHVFYSDLPGHRKKVKI